MVELDVDFACGGSVKWLCGGPGAGYLYVRPDLTGQGIGGPVKMTMDLQGPDQALLTTFQRSLKDELSQWASGS